MNTKQRIAPSESGEKANNIWKQIINEIKRISPDIYSTINKPYTLHQFVDNFPILNVPPSFLDYLLVFNGQSEKGNDFPLLDSTRFLPVNEIMKTIDLQIKLFGSEEPLSHIKENKIKPVLWNKLWIPFAEFNGDTRLILDLDAGKNGRNGQVIMLWSGIDPESDELVVASSFEEFGKIFLNHLKNNDFKMENGKIRFLFQPAPSETGETAEKAMNQ